MNTFHEIVTTPTFSITITLVIFSIATLLYHKTRLFFLNPVLVAVVTIIIFLKIFNIDYDTYNKGGNIISFFLGPAVVALALPLYHQRRLIKQHGLTLLISITSGLLAGTATAVFIAKLGGLSQEAVISLTPKSVTTPIAIAVTQKIGGNVSMTAAFVVIAGILGAAVGPLFLKKIRIQSKTAFGAAMGTASHGIGTARANEEGETEGAFSGLALCLAGVITSILLPIIIKLIF